MKPRAHRVCTFSRLFSDFQNSLALRNMTESSLTEGRSCFALRLIGQGTEMSVFFPHLSKAEHVRQTKKYPGNPCFPRFPAPCEAEHRRQPGRSYFGTCNHTGADSVSRLHLGKGRKHFPDVFCCPEWGNEGLPVRKRYASHQSLSCQDPRNRTSHCVKTAGRRSFEALSSRGFL